MKGIVSYLFCIFSVSDLPLMLNEASTISLSLTIPSKGPHDMHNERIKESSVSELTLLILNETICRTCRGRIGRLKFSNVILPTDTALFLDSTLFKTKNKSTINQSWSDTRVIRRREPSEKQKQDRLWNHITFINYLKFNITTVESIWNSPHGSIWDLPISWHCLFQPAKMEKRRYILNSNWCRTFEVGCIFLSKFRTRGISVVLRFEMWSWSAIILFRECVHQIPDAFWWQRWSFFGTDTILLLKRGIKLKSSHTWNYSIQYKPREKESQFWWKHTLEAQLFCFEAVPVNFSMLSGGKDEGFLVLILLCFLSEELSSSQVTLEIIQSSTNREIERESVLQKHTLKVSGFSVINMGNVPTLCSTGRPNSEKSSSSPAQLCVDLVRLSILSNWKLANGRAAKHLPSTDHYKFSK